MNRLAGLLIAALSTAPLAAQGHGYAFDEREPVTALESVIDATLPSLVKVHGASGLSTISAYSTGVIVSSEGHVLTLDLVSIQAGQTRIVLADGSVHDAELLPPEPALGLRLLKIDPAEVRIPLRPLVPESALPDPGSFVASIGNCFRLAEFSEKLSVTFGLVSATTDASAGLRYRLHDVDYDGRLILTDAANNTGHFGGALVTLDGRWVGLNARLVESKETNTLLSAAIPCADLEPYVNRWVHGVVSDTENAPAQPAGFHGIRLFDAGGRRSPPAYIERVQRDSPARAAGLKPDDLIVRIGERSIRTCAEFEAEMAGHPAGTEIELTFKRGDAVQRVRLVLGDAR